MNLYMVEHKDADWGVYVFAPNASKAKSTFYHARGIYNCDDIAYTDIRAYLCKKDLAGECELVDDYEGSGYQRVKDAGYKFNDWEEE